MKFLTLKLSLIVSLFFVSLAPAAYQLTPILTEGVEDPIYIAPVPGEAGSFWIVEQAGRIKRLKNGVLDAKPVLDISRKVKFGGEMGLLGLAFHPQFEKNKRFFLNYNPASDMATIVAEFNADTLAEKTILKFAQPFSNHNGGMLEFGTDGHLYISTGDGGSGGDPQNNGQKLDTLLGKILRINVDGAAPYSIPKDNPLVGKAGRGEIFAWGLRNVWRFSFDRKTGLMFGGDVGQNKYEEIDIIEKGKNYGWVTMEGTHCFRPEKNCETKGLTNPIFEYPRSEGISITGGYVYRGSKLPALDGVYVYSDFGSGKIWGLTWDADSKRAVKNELLVNSHQPISSFGQDTDGELFALSYAGMIYRLEEARKK